MNENLDLRVDARYRLLRKLGRGAFGVVYEATDLETDRNVAIKLEHVITIQESVLESEVAALERLSRVSGIPRVYATGEDGDYRYIVLELLGPSLQDLLRFCGGKFSLKTVLMLADQLIRRVEHLHRRGFVHRDIKPHNFLMGLERYGNMVYMIDFGICVYSAPTPVDLYSQTPRTIGTDPFASVSGHVNFGRCRCDDLESLGYVFLHFIRGHLPWANVKAESGTQLARMLLEQKKSISTEDLCAGLPKAFAAYFNHIRSQQNDNDEPNYSYLRKIFHSQFLREGFKHDNIFDWTILRFLQTTTAATTATTIRSPQHLSLTSAKQSAAAAAAAAAGPSKNKSLRRSKGNSHEQEGRSKSTKQATKTRKGSRAKKQVSRQANGCFR